jgi:hypothetical protein
MQKLLLGHLDLKKYVHVLLSREKLRKKILPIVFMRVQNFTPETMCIRGKKTQQPGSLTGSVSICASGKEKERVLRIKYHTGARARRKPDH